MQRTAAESRLHAISVMGEPLGELYSALWQEVAAIHETWGEYVILFGTKESRVTLMNKAAPRFTRLVQDTLWEHVLLHIARLTDPPQSMNRENLSIKALPPLVSRAELQDPVAQLIARATSEADFARDWRNRRLAHRDLALALERPAAPLKLGSRNSVKTVLATFVELLNLLNKHYFDATTIFDFRDEGRGALSLLYVVDDGLRAEQARRDRLRSGNLLPEDYARRDL
jgi:hypothetical protein